MQLTPDFKLCAVKVLIVKIILLFLNKKIQGMEKSHFENEHYLMHVLEYRNGQGMGENCRASSNARKALLKQETWVESGPSNLGPSKVRVQKD